MKNFNVTSMLVMLMFMCITSMQAQSITPSKKYITKELAAPRRLLPPRLTICSQESVDGL